MPLHSHITNEGNLQLALWTISENSEDLKKKLSRGYQEAAMEKRANQANALHYLASRCIIKEIFPNQLVLLNKNEFNQPTLLVNQKPFHISITHAADMAGIYVSEQHLPGLDLEKIDPRIARVKHKFMNQLELDFAGAENQINLQTLIWSAKEALYKVYGKKELDFKEHLQIHPFGLNQTNAGTFVGIIKKDNFFQKHNIHYQIISNIVLTYTSTYDAEN
jgi:phosphopantetheinyl transferase